MGWVAEPIGSKRLSEIVRQKDAWERQAALNLAEGRTKNALSSIDSHGGLNILNDRNDARHAMLAEWRKGTNQELDKIPS